MSIFLLPPSYMADYRLPTDNLLVVSTVWSLLGEYESQKIRQNLTMQVYVLSTTIAEQIQYIKNKNLLFLSWDWEAWCL